MTDIVHARAYANNEVAFLAWETSDRLAGCLGFEILRLYLDDHDNVTEAVPLAAYVPFKGQSNPDWTAQNTSLWPVQKFTWRDLTLRKRRDRAERRPDEVRVRYSIRPVCLARPDLPAVTPREEGEAGHRHSYQGDPVPLSYLGDAVETNAVTVTRNLPPFQATFTNGVLSGQWLVRALKEDDGKIGEGELKRRLVQGGDAWRNYLAGDVLPLFRDFFALPGGRFHMALYELEDDELEDLILANAERIDLILANTGKQENGGWDGRNRPARDRLIAQAARPGTAFRLHHRMFNNSTQIGHNKFAVWSDGGGVARHVLTGSTNWTWSGLTGQSNNACRIDDDTVARRYKDYWDRLLADPLPLPDPLDQAMPASRQGQALRKANQAPQEAVALASGRLETWFSPNMGPRKPPTRPEPPPDLGQLFGMMRKAKSAIFFLAFYPAMQGRNSIVAQAVDLGLADPSLLVVGAVSQAEAMVNFTPKEKTSTGEVLPADRPFVYQRNNTSVVRAAALDDLGLIRQLGDFQNEILKAGNAIIHDKILVLDPLDDETCTVAFGSHNLGYKASYANDENLVIVRGHRRLAEAYAVHVMDVYDHYRFRAAEAELRAEGKKGWDGFLDRTDAWQDRAGRRLSRYFSGAV